MGIPRSYILFARRYVFVLGKCVTSLVKVFFSPKDRKRLRQWAFELGFSGVPTKLPVMREDDIIDAGLTVNIRSPKVTKWSVSLYELTLINAIIQRSSATRVLEIGTYDGRTALNMACNVGAGGHVYTLDLPEAERTWPDGTRKLAFEGTDLEGRITQLLGNSHEYEFASYASNIDLVFVDAGHDYEDVRQDSFTADYLIGDRDGVIIWHDYARFEGVTTAVNEFYKQHKDQGEWCWIEGTTLAVFWKHRARKQATRF